MNEWSLVTGRVLKETVLHDWTVYTEYRNRVAWRPDGREIAWTAEPTGLMTVAAGGAPVPPRFGSYPEHTPPRIQTARGLAANERNRGVHVVDDPQSPDGIALAFVDPDAETPGEVWIDMANAPHGEFPTGARVLFSLRMNPDAGPNARWGQGFLHHTGARPEGSVSADVVPRDASSLWTFWQLPPNPGPDPLVQRFFHSKAPTSPAGLARFDYAVYVAIGNNQIGDLAWSPDGKRLWGTFDATKRLAAWDVEKLSPTIRWDNRASELTTGMSQIRAIAVGDRWVACGCRNGRLAIIPAGEGTTREADGPGGPIQCVALNPEETWAVIGTLAGHVEFRSVPEGEKLSAIEDHRDGVESVALARDGRLLATAGDEGLVRLFRVETKNGVPAAVPWLTLNPRAGAIDTVRMDADGKWLVAIPHDSTAVCVWNLTEIRQQLVLMGAP